MRECPENYAHGPMKLKSEDIALEYRGELFTCERIVYACTKCDFEEQQQWMKEKMESSLKEAYTRRHPEN